MFLSKSVKNRFNFLMYIIWTIFKNRKLLSCLRYLIVASDIRSCSFKISNFKWQHCFRQTKRYLKYINFFNGFWKMAKETKFFLSWFWLKTVFNSPLNPSFIKIRFIFTLDILISSGTQWYLKQSSKLLFACYWFLFDLKFFNKKIGISVFISNKLYTFMKSTNYYF